MSGVGEGGRGRSKSEYNPNAYRNSMPPIHELGELKLDNKGEPVDATERQKIAGRRGLRLPRSESITPSAMAQQLKDIEDAEKAAAKEAKEAPKPLRYGAKSADVPMKSTKTEAPKEDTDKNKSRRPSI